MQFGIEVAIELPIGQFQRLGEPLLRTIHITLKQQHFGHHHTLLRKAYLAHDAPARLDGCSEIFEPLLYAAYVRQRPSSHAAIPGERLYAVAFARNGDTGIYGFQTICPIAAEAGIPTLAKPHEGQEAGMAN